jgi:hypothetical protein
MCKCGCNTCETKGPLLTEGKVKSLLSEGLQYHIDKKIPLFETVYRIGSNKHLSLIKEARKMYSRNVINLCEEDEALIKTHLGEFGLFCEIEMGDKVKASKEYGGQSGEVVDIKGSFIVVKTKKGNKSYHESDLQVLNKEGVAVPLDLPMLDEGTYEEGGEDDRKYALLKVRPENYNLMIDKLQDMNINHTRHSGTEGVIKVYTDRIPDKVLYRLTHDVWVDKFVLKEAEFRGKNVSLNKPKRGGSKAYYVYVRDPKTKKIKKVSFGSGGLRAKIKNKVARNAFAKRHNCDQKKDRTKPGYWSCNLPRYAQALGLGANMNTFW